ncbi:MAG: 3-deoxy-manno-octulosonate cytidylyltransferase [Elusimicrobiota bacterium]
MKVLGCIPARFGAMRFPGKPLKLIMGKPMIEWVYKRAAIAKNVDRTIVLTDDDRIYNAVVGFGGEALITSPNAESGTERICSIMDSFNDYDIFVNIQGDEPLVNSADIDKTVALLKNDDKAEVATIASHFKDIETIDDPNLVKAVVGNNDRVLYFSRSRIPFIRDPKDAVSYKYLKHIGLYVYTKNALRKFRTFKKTTLEQLEKLEQLRFLENGIGIKLTYTENEFIAVDCAEDIKKVEKYIKNNPDIKI